MTAHRGVEGADEALAGALEYAAAGYAVGPVTIRWESERGKKRPDFHTHWEHPRAPDDVTISADQDQIVAWARQFPGTGFHAPCGPNGFVVAEGDLKRARESGAIAIKDGITAWREAGGPTPTMTVRTPSGGQHWYFPAPEEPIRNSEGVVLPGVDVRGAGGTVFIAGTRVHGHPAGAEAFYSATRVVPVAELTPLPEHWERRLRAAHKGTGSSGAAGGSSGGAGPGVTTPDQVHDASWIEHAVLKARGRAARVNGPGNFHTELFALAIVLYKAANADVVEHEWAEAECRAFVRRVWNAEPDADDRRWLREARAQAAANPWRVRPDRSASGAASEGGEHAPVDTPVDGGPDVGGTASGTQHASEDAPVDEDADEHTTWWPRDIEPLLDDDPDDEPGPCVLRRTDGAALLYAGRVNGVIGESESGKSWVAQYAVAQTIIDGGHVLYYDFEDSHRGVVTRLRALGVPPEVIRRRFVYVGPEESLSALARDDTKATLAARDWTLIAVDGFNMAMGLLGLDLQSNEDATKFFSVFLRPLSRTGAAVFYVDHVPKDPQGRNKGGIGAQAKRAMTDGATIRAEVQAAFGRGQAGKLRLTVDKDRMGHVRGISDESTYVGMFKLTSTDAESGAVTAEIEGGSKVGPPEPTAVMESVSRFLQGSPTDWFSTNQITGEVKGRRTVITEALNALKLRGCVERREGERRAVQYRFARRFTRFVAEVDDVVASTSEDSHEDESEGLDDA